MSDLLVNLYNFDESSPEEMLKDSGIAIVKANIIDKDRVLHFVRINFPDEPGWVFECEYAMMNNPISCYIAVREKEIVGFSCYDATAKGFFGPLGISRSFQKQGIGTALLKKTLLSMKDFGYAYAIIGWPRKKAIDFYVKTTNAVVIDGWNPKKSVYSNIIEQN